MVALKRAVSGADRPGVMSVDAARLRALSEIVPVEGEELVPLHSARGRVTATAVMARHALPPFDQSAMDGYAVRTSDFVNRAAAFRVVARRAAGPQYYEVVPDVPAAVRIFTGAAVPFGFDAVVTQEECTRLQAGVVIPRRPICGENIRLSGEDVPAGAKIVDADIVIDSRHIAILAAAGVPTVSVRRRVRVTVLSTGNELREPHERLNLGEVHDCNRTMLLSLLEAPAIERIDLGRVPDDPEAIAQTFRAAASESDIVLSTGGVSVGEEDHVRSSVTSAGGTLSSLKASIKPGKPVSVGHLGNASIIGLPGNPVSALVTFLWFARPIVQRRMGLNPSPPRSLRAVAGFDEVRRPGRDEFLPVAVSGRDQSGRYIIVRRGPGGSARLSPLIAADGLARISGNINAVSRGSELEFYPFEGQFGV